MKIFNLVMLLLMIVACGSNEEKDVETVEITPTLLIDDLEMTLPGDVTVMDSLIIIDKVRPIDNLINIYSLNALQLKSSFCNIGRAANELIQADIIVENDTTFIAYDLNGKGIYYSTKDLSVIKTRNDLGYGYDNRCKIDSDFYVEMNRDENSDSLLIYCNDGKKQFFGKCPIVGDYENKMSLRRGEMQFTVKDSTLHFISSVMPYAAKYKLINNRFTFLSEVFFNKYNVTKNSKGEASIEYDNFLLVGLAFTENYIIRLRRSPEDNAAYANAAKNVNDFSNLPKHLYLYDYDLNLVKIVNLGVNTLSMGAEGLNSDVLYLICSVDGAFNISKVEL